MIQLDLVELADLTTPEALAREIHRQNPAMQLPVPVEEIARAAGINELQSIGANGFEGALVTNAEKSEGIILYNDAVAIPRQRFTKGHELGHFLLPWHRQSKFQCTSADLAKGDGRGDWEVEANQFSAELLMPLNRFRARMKALGSPDLEHGLVLEEEFGTSFEATVRRYISLSDFPCAVVFSKNNQVRYYLKSPEFPFYVAAKPGASLPSKSPSRADGGSLDDWDELDASWWLSARGDQRLPETVLEQTYRQDNGYKVTLLFCELEEE
jgi:Zn-dependent peptidase ImmA (M78 family)